MSAARQSYDHSISIKSRKVELGKSQASKYQRSERSEKSEFSTWPAFKASFLRPWTDTVWGRKNNQYLSNFITVSKAGNYRSATQTDEFNCIISIFILKGWSRARPVQSRSLSPLEVALRATPTSKARGKRGEWTLELESLGPGKLMVSPDMSTRCRYYEIYYFSLPSQGPRARTRARTRASQDSNFLSKVFFLYTCYKGE